MHQKIVEAALRTLENARDAVESISAEFKLWRSCHPKDPIEGGRGLFLFGELKECRAREENCQKTLQILISATAKNDRIFGEKEKRSAAEHGAEPAQLRKKVKSVAIATGEDLGNDNGSVDTATALGHPMPMGMGANEVGSIATATAVQSESDSDKSSSSGSDSSSSDSNSNLSSSSSSSSSDSSDTSDSDSEEKAAAPIPVINATIKIPSNLSKGKLKAVRGMLDIPPAHKYFNDEEVGEEFNDEEVGEEALNQSRVIYSEVRLYNPKGTNNNTGSKIPFGKKQRKRNIQAQVVAEQEELENEELIEEEVQTVNYDSLQLYTEKRPPAEGSVITFKRLELTHAYTPELSGWKRATISKIDIDFDGSKTKFMLSLTLDARSVLQTEPKMVWEPKINQLSFGNQTIGKFDLEPDLDMNMEDHQGLIGDETLDAVIVVDWSTLLEVKLVPRI